MLPDLLERLFDGNSWQLALGLAVILSTVAAQRRRAMELLSFVRKHWFLIGLVAVIVLAHLNPQIGKKGGILKPEWTVKYGAVFLIFFNSGLTLRSEDLKAAALQVRVHTVIQGFTLMLVPVAMMVLVQVLQNATSIAPSLLKGLLVLGCMPPPVSSAVILTKAAGGNDAAAIFNSAFGSFLGIFVTPALLMYTVGESAGVPVSKIFTSLSLTVVLPILLGQLLRYQAWERIRNLGIPFSTISSSVLLLIIYSTFCDTFSGHVDVDVTSLVAVVITVVAILLFEMAVLFMATTRARFAPRDVVCILFCATHKSLTLGIPMLNIVFAGSPELSLISLPLLVYHPTQILLGGLLVPTVRSWLTKADIKRSPMVRQKTVPVAM
eukprot:TRINITY_DN12161_c1_g2_i3.p1 TRINITY_DN12161_c1_g2~~TRINITY_DN12161_c1_g2_i3.p1  ORF type:complete len:380 (+),score=47.51 TRINITY_DN12161_c1_g2_i3:65-1204(+)